MNIYFNNLNTCTRVKLYGEDVKELFRLNNTFITEDKEKADLIIINTCSFLKTKEDFFLNLIRKEVLNKKENQKIAIIGCLGGTNKDAILEIDKNILIFKRDIEDIKEYFAFKNLPKTKTTSVEDNLSSKKEALYLFNKYILHSKHIEYRLKRDKVCYLQISTGCLGKCTYCSEKFITKLKSRPILEIMEAIQEGINKGYTLFGLNSDDASAYGKDIGESLEKLLIEVSNISEDIYFSIPEFNPQGLTEEVINILLNDKKFLYITIPIQSGSQRILDLMERPYKIEDVIKKIRAIKAINNKLMINTHIIVGFPGETEEDFEKTKQVLKTGLFDRVKVFMYSERPNTKAISFEGKVPDEIKIKRRDELLKIIKRNNIKNMSLTNLILNKDQLK